MKSSATTAVKICMATQYPHHSDALFLISAQDLFKKCVEDDVPFHNWHEWLFQELFGNLKWTAETQTDSKKKPQSESNQSASQQPRRAWIDSTK